MSDLNPDIAADVVAACQAGTEEAVDALGRSLDGEFALTVGEAGTYSSDVAGLDGPGLAIVLKFGDVGMAIMLPEASGVLPEWYASPDPTGESKLSTLAQELSMLLVPESLIADAFEAAHVESLQEALARGTVAEDAAWVPLTLQSGENSGQLSLVWPLAAPDAVLPAAEAEPEPAAPAPSNRDDSPAPVAEQGQPPAPRIHDFSQLPGYARSLLKIKVSVSVRLATRKESVQEVVELATGSIIQFDKGCEEQLHLLIGEQCIAEGEAVKVGDKFGFRVNSMLMPEEHFLKARRPQAG